MAKAETTATEESTPVAPQETQQPAPASLSINDLIIATKLIQLGAERNTYTPEELPDVAILNNKLIAFLTSVGAIGPVPETASTEEKKDD